MVVLKICIELLFLSRGGEKTAQGSKLIVDKHGRGEACGGGENHRGPYGGMNDPLKRNAVGDHRPKITTRSSQRSSAREDQRVVIDWWCCCLDTRSQWSQILLKECQKSIDP